MAFLLDHLPAAAAPGDRQPRRSGAAAGPPARARRARRDPRRRPALHARRGRGVPQRGDGPGPDGARTSPRWRGAPKAGSPRSSWRRSRCRGATTSPASSPASPGTTATSSTTWSKRSCSASPSRSGASCCRPSILDRLSGPLCDAVTGQDGGKAMLEALERGEPVRRPARRPPPVVSLPPPLRRRAARAPAGRAARPTSPTCTGGRASGTSRTASRSEAIRHALAAEDFERAADLVELADAGDAPGVGRRPRCSAGSRRSPTS